LRGGADQSQGRDPSDPAAESSGGQRGAGPSYARDNSHATRGSFAQVRLLAYEGRAFLLMEKLFNEYPHMAQPPEEWLPLQIRRTPGLDKCIFPV